MMRVLMFVGSCVVLSGAIAFYGPRWLGFAASTRRAIVVGFLVRVVLIGGVFAASLLPAVRATGAAAGPGLWMVMPDTAVYHISALAQRHAAQRDVNLRFPDGYSAIIGSLYTSVGPLPLVGIVVNLISDSVTLLLLVILCRTMTGLEPRPIFTWAIVLWPSWLVWSTQLLKDSMLLTLSIAGLALIAGIARRATRLRREAIYGFLDWLALAGVIVVIGLFRPGVADMFPASLAIFTLWLFGAMCYGRVRWTQVAVMVGLLAFVVYVHIDVRGKAYPISADTTVAGYVALGRAYEKEGIPTEAVRAYRAALRLGKNPRLHGFATERIRALIGTEELEMAPPLGAESGLDVYVPPPRGPLTAGLFGRLQDYARRFSLQRIEALRRANLIGQSQFGADASVATFRGLLMYMPRGIAHTLFAPFPWRLYDANASTGVLRVLALVEYPWMYCIPVLAVVGLYKSIWRRGSLRPLVFGVFGFLGIMALALTVPNDGLLFRYRLPFLAALLIAAATVKSTKSEVQQD
jgi:hypothetical protein